MNTKQSIHAPVELIIDIGLESVILPSWSPNQETIFRLSQLGIPDAFISDVIPGFVQPIDVSWANDIRQ